jgi:hypothetical protein
MDAGSRCDKVTTARKTDAEELVLPHLSEIPKRFLGASSMYRFEDKVKLRRELVSAPRRALGGCAPDKLIAFVSEAKVPVVNHTSPRPRINVCTVLKLKSAWRGKNSFEFGSDSRSSRERIASLKRFPIRSIRSRK